jgi:endoribonuclease Dicer
MSAPLARGQWIPTCIEYGEGTELKQTDPVGSKVYADIIESLLGLVYLEFGYEVALKAADDLHLTMSRTNDFLENYSEYTSNKVFEEAVRLCTGYESFRVPELAEEAFTHPSANHPGVSSYQRLEFIGDAVLCLYMREWIFKEFQHLSLGDLVVFEAALVSNETLAFLSVRNGLQHYLQHNDHSLPSRIEAYCWNVREQGSGLWGAGEFYNRSLVGLLGSS